MGFVTIRGEGVLAYVLPTADGGTELVYLAGEHEDGLLVRLESSDDVPDGLVGSGRTAREPNVGVPDAAGSP
jgi:hypothetical protein